MFYKYYDELTWEEVEKLDKEKCCVLLPLSSIEQHGKHLPVGTDDYITDTMAKILVTIGKK